MSDMSYCRFQNTLEDLRDCAEHITDEVVTDERDGMSEDEAKARTRLIKICKQIVDDAEDNDIN